MNKKLGEIRNEGAENARCSACDCGEFGYGKGFNKNDELHTPLVEAARLVINCFTNMPEDLPVSKLRKALKDLGYG